MPIAAREQRSNGLMHFARDERHVASVEKGFGAELCHNVDRLASKDLDNEGTLLVRLGAVGIAI